MKTRFINHIHLEEKHLPYKWGENLVSNGKIGGVMLVFVEGFSESEIERKTKSIKEHCKTLKDIEGGEDNMSTLQYVAPTDEQKTLMQTFRDKYEALFTELKALEKSRGMSLCLTKLEESAMWLNKAITKND